MPQARAAGAARPRARRRALPRQPSAAAAAAPCALLLVLLSARLLVAPATAASAPQAGACAAASPDGACAAAAAAATITTAAATEAPAKGRQEQPLVCVVVRTYWAHGSHGDGGLTARLLSSLRAQTHGNWRALLLVLDSRPFPDLHHLVADLGDPRVEVLAEWIAARYAARAPAPAAAAAGGAAADAAPGWSPSYHDALYNATDVAVRACPRETEWLAVTNGDNEYDPEFFAAAVAAGARGGADIVAADYYTRYVRPTGPPCDRFSSSANAAAAATPEDGREAAAAGRGAGGKGAPPPTTAAPAPAGPPAAPAPPSSPCKSNLLRWCQTDLAATLYYWPRFVEEDVRFWDASLPGDAAGSHDGRLAEALTSSGLAALRRRKAAAAWAAAAAAAAKDGGGAAPPGPPPYVPAVPGEETPWRAVRLFPGERCMVDHHPSPQRCAAEAGVWDDSRRATPGATGGRCLSKGEAGLLLAADQGLDLGGPPSSAAGLAGRKPPAPRLLELVEVDVAHDGRGFVGGFSGGGKARPPASPLPRLRCIRLRDRAAWPREARFFGPKCDAVQEGGEGWTYG